MPSQELAGRAAVITGGSRGLGRAIAGRFVEEGASVLLVARELAALEAACRQLAGATVSPGQHVEALAGDVADPATAEAVALAARERFPDLQILVNNAGVYGPMGRFEQLDFEAWTQALRINLLGTARLCRAVIPLLRARNYGKIVNLSGGGASAPLPRFSAYAASKAAVVRLTETLAEELRDAHVDVNALAPGALDTRLLEEVLAAGPQRVGREFHERAQRLRQGEATPLARGADLAVFLASKRSDGITGRLLSAVWDAWAELPARRSQLESSDVFTLRRIVPRDRGFDW